MERAERNHLIKKIRKFVQRDKKGHLKKKHEILDYLEGLLGAVESQYINIFERFDRLTYKDRKRKSKYYAPFSVIVYFPWESLEIICSRDTALRIPYIQTLLTNESFEERSIDIEWIDLTAGAVKGPQILISLANSKSIILENGSGSLHAALVKY